MSTDCDGLRRAVVAIPLDQPLPRELVVRVRAHFGSCERCRCALAGLLMVVEESGAGALGLAGDSAVRDDAMVAARVQERKLVGAGVSPASCSLPGLLERMRDGDRDAAADFMDRYGQRIRRRAQMKMSAQVRRVFDSDDILSTVAHRLDKFVESRRIGAATVGELWSLVYRLASNAVIDRARVAHGVSESTDGESLFGSGRTEEDRMILQQRLQGIDLAEIAGRLGIPRDALRVRWKRIRSEIMTMHGG